MRDRTREMDEAGADGPNGAVDGMANLAVIEVRLDMIDWLRVAASGDERFVLRACDEWRPSPLVP